MDKDNEIYVTSNGELYKKGVEQAVYPQTNYTTQQFYTKEEYEQLQAENERLKEESKNYCIQLQVLAQALEDIRDIIDSRFKTAYMTFGYKEYDKLIEDIDKIVNEVIGAEE